MTKQEIETYEYCKNHLNDIKNWIENMPFKWQKYGGGTGSPDIEYVLQKIHLSMHDKVHESINEAKETIQKIIDDV